MVAATSGGVVRRLLAQTGQRLGAGIGALRQPIVIGQVASSLAGALIMLLGALVLSSDELATLGVLTLLQGLTTNGVRALVFQPALLVGRLHATSVIRPRYALGVAAAVYALWILVVPLLLRLDARWVAAVSALFALSALQDWLRHNLIGSGRLRVLMYADILRLIMTLISVGVVLLSGSGESALGFAVAGVSAIVLSGVPLLFVKPWGGEWLSWGRFSSTARSQFMEFLVASATSSLPILLLGIIGGSRLIGPIRLAQSLLGPLNMAFSAASSSMLAFVSRGGEAGIEAKIVQVGMRVAKGMLAASSALVVSALAIVWLAQIGIGEVGYRELGVGLLLTGLVAIGSGVAGSLAVVLRLLLRQRAVTKARLAVTITSGLGFGVGFIVGSVDLSLVVGLLVSAVSFPAYFWLASRDLFPVEGGAS